ncbi:Tetratricopeptide repeat,Tetratricopeptide repeat 1,SGTA, homodimerisation domain,Tetratricopeptide [Cinara cedri]|uniref:Tetratricopeptide repeat,Tetratricopeptide repeat 1,SGTA, homodimerisation domain,Tetratricopeptide n=1 Tax=Cinara cedri TaxID=506608 RepID=A0A5E4N7N5_9HEMI|nr:Tetratricopeptide repeat,Tetratricopeptide repeat 1,SGTA, homodimerisation domain,Tetratricopeptide [Cinara cedri]
MEDKKKLALLIVNHLKNELHSGNFSEENMESLEVSVQCIESAYSLNVNESDNVDIKLEDIIRKYFQSGKPVPPLGASGSQSGASTSQSGASTSQHRASSFQPGTSVSQPGTSASQPGASAPPFRATAPPLGASAAPLEAEQQRAQDFVNLANKLTKDEKEAAEYHKNCGNEFMKSQNNERAIESYTKSIKLNPYNPIFYCNRAAAYNALGNYTSAIADCEKAIELDSTYGKAYCRLGLAFSYLKDYHKAVTCYKKACDLDPGNIGYQRNYQLTLNNLQTNPGSGGPGSQNGASNIMETAARLMNDADVSSVLNNILRDDDPNHGGLNRLMQVGQTLVTRLQTTNPNLLDGIRMHFEAAQQEQESPQSPPPPNNGFSNDETRP